MGSLHIQNLRFRGLKNTQIIAKGTLAEVADPKRAGATLTIQKLHTTQAILLYSRAAVYPMHK
jgi:hypothetical protein